MARVLISMPDEFLSKIDEVADTESRTRSELIREALRTYIHKTRVRENAMATKNASILETLLD
jgi:CopG family transcriptional regulator / antitoxin EndoAI